MENFKELYNQYLAAVENRMQEYLADIKPDILYEPFRYLVSGGGKRIRPVLMMISAGAVGGDPERAVGPAAALEFLHNFTLVHDDIMDKSPLRRGRATVHTKWNESTAILTGDVMVGHAYRLLPDRKNHENSDEIIKAFNNALIEVCEGQAYDMDFNMKKDVTIENYIMMIDRKTARLIETAAVMGAYIGHGTIDDIESLRRFGNALGLAFQLRDDLLDITADEAMLGKKIGRDIVEGKKTYLIIRAREKATESSDIELLNRFYENDGLPETEISAMKDMMERLGVFEYASDLTEKYLAQARVNLTELKACQYTEMLEWLVGLLSSRNH